jgi:hypothetical protein
VENLTRNQARALDGLIRRGRGSATDPELALRLTDYIEEGLAGVDVQGISLNKQAIKVAEECPGRLDATLRREGGDWSMTAEFAVGRVLHRAAQVDAGARIELPLDDVVEHAISRLMADRFQQDFADFWNDADEATRADVRAGVVTALDMLRATLPPMADLRREGAVPIPELPLSHDLPSGVRLAGRIDLCLGAVEFGSATRLLLDLKTGSAAKAYPEDMRVYALLHTLRYETPPYRVATVFLPGGTWQPEDIDAHVLFRAADRVIATAKLASELLVQSAEPHLTPGPHCRWCPRLATCPAAADGTWRSNESRLNAAPVR